MLKQPVSIVRSAPRPECQPLVRWVFQRKQTLLTCEVAVGATSYEVSVVPHGDVSQSVVEPFARATDALWRHAEIASSLRDKGWVVAERMPIRRLNAA